MERVRTFFKIHHSYRFEWNDLRAALQFINFVLLVCSFSAGAIFGLVIAVIGLIKDITIDRHINGTLMHLIGIMLNGYILFFC